MVTEAKRESIHRKADIFLNQLANGEGEKLRPYFYEVIDTIFDETLDLQQRKAESSDVKELIIEMREGFKRMDQRFELMQAEMNRRFEQVEKRFEQVEKRFELIDKRFESMQAEMNRRFEQVEKRFELIDKRFESIDARFNRLYQFMMWMMGVIATGFFGLYLKLFFLSGAR